MVSDIVEVSYLRWIVLAPACAAGLLAIWVAVLRRELPPVAVFVLGCGSLIVSSVATLFAFAELVTLESDRLLIDVFYTWIGAGVADSAFSSDFALQFDPLSAVMCMLVCSVGLIVHVYSIAYMDADQRGDRLVAGIGRGRAHHRFDGEFAPPGLAPIGLGGQKILKQNRFVLVPDTAGTAEIGNSRFGADPGAGKHHRARGRFEPLAQERAVGSAVSHGFAAMMA